jgi:imidazolonepropionase-like amidohydrolase
MATFLVVGFCWTTEPALAQESAEPLYITNANVLDGISPNVLTNATVVVVNGRIERIERGAVTPPAGAQIVDIEGRYLLPGLMAAHSHVNTLSGVRMALESGVTTIRTAGVGGYADVAIRDMVKQGILPGPDIVATGVYVTPNLGGAVLADERLYRLHSGVDTPATLRHLVQVNLDHGVNWIKTRGTERAGLPETDPRQQVYTERQLRVIVEEAGKSDVAIMSHAHGDEGVRASVLAGVRSIEHGTYASDETLRLMQERGTYLVPTLSSISSFGQAGDYADPALFLRGLHMAPRRREAVQRAYAMGIKIVTGVDTNYGPESFSRVSREAGFLVELGVTPIDAIRGATSLAAELFGIEDQTGSIRPGLEADLIVVDTNPLDDIRSLQDALIVISNGHVVLNRLPFAKRETDE